MLKHLLKLSLAMALMSGCAQGIGGLPTADAGADVEPSDVAQSCSGDACQTGPECETWLDCDPGEGCLGGTCQASVGACHVTADCDEGQTCEAGLCRNPPAGCTVPTDCDPGDVCVDGVCEPDASCDALTDCEPGEVCSAQSCTALGSCERIAGATRYDTAVELSRRFYPDGADAVVLVVDQESAPDGLSAGPLAFAKNGPILFTRTDSLPDATRGEINRLQPDIVYVIGGTAAIGATVEGALQTDGHQTQRVAGDSRFATAAAVARLVGGGSLAVVTSADAAHYVDGLLASAVAARLGVPLLLVNADTVPAATDAALLDLGITRTIVPGGSLAVSDSVLAMLPNATRVGGATRFETAVAIADWAAIEGVAAPTRFVAGGAAVLDMIPTTAAGVPLLLTAPDQLPPSTASALGTVSSAVVVGGTAAVSESTKTAICGALSP